MDAFFKKPLPPGNLKRSEAHPYRGRQMLMETICTESHSARDFTDAVLAMASLFNTGAPLTEDEALPVVEELSAISSDVFGKWLESPRSFAGAWNLEMERLKTPGTGTSLEESVYKPWTRDSSHPLAGRTGFTHGDPAAHMAEVLDTFGVCREENDFRSPDHLSVILEFLALAMTIGHGNVVRPFCLDHLDWLGALEAAARSSGATELFIDVLQATAALIKTIVDPITEKTDE